MTEEYLYTNCSERQDFHHSISCIKIILEGVGRIPQVQIIHQDKSDDDNYPNKLIKKHSTIDQYQSMVILQE
jgi:hypothetical protein